MSEEAAYFWTFILGGVFGFLIGTATAVHARNSYWANECVKRGHAEYSQTTGQWQWKEAAK